MDLALGLKAVIMLLNPARIVIGGGIAKAGDKLFGPLRAECGARSRPGRAPASTLCRRTWRRQRTLRRFGADKGIGQNEFH